MSYNGSNSSYDAPSPSRSLAEYSPSLPGLGSSTSLSLSPPRSRGYNQLSPRPATNRAGFLGEESESDLMTNSNSPRIPRKATGGSSAMRDMLEVLDSEPPWEQSRVSPTLTMPRKKSFGFPGILRLKSSTLSSSSGNSSGDEQIFRGNVSSKKGSLNEEDDPFVLSLGVQTRKISGGNRVEEQKSVVAESGGSLGRSSSMSRSIGSSDRNLKGILNRMIGYPLADEEMRRDEGGDLKGLTFDSSNFLDTSPLLEQKAGSLRRNDLHHQRSLALLQTVDPVQLSPSNLVRKSSRRKPPPTVVEPVEARPAHSDQLALGTLPSPPLTGNSSASFSSARSHAPIVLSNPFLVPRRRSSVPTTPGGGALPVVDEAVSPLGGGLNTPPSVDIGAYVATQFAASGRPLGGGPRRRDWEKTDDDVTGFGSPRSFERPPRPAHYDDFSPSGHFSPPKVVPRVLSPTTEGMDRVEDPVPSSTGIGALHFIATPLETPPRRFPDGVSPSTSKETKQIRHRSASVPFVQQYGPSPAYEFPVRVSLDGKTSESTRAGEGGTTTSGRGLELLPLRLRPVPARERGEGSPTSTSSRNVKSLEDMRINSSPPLRPIPPHRSAPLDQPFEYRSLKPNSRGGSPTTPRSSRPPTPPSKSIDSTATFGRPEPSPAILELDAFIKDEENRQGVNQEDRSSNEFLLAALTSVQESMQEIGALKLDILPFLEMEGTPVLGSIQERRIDALRPSLRAMQRLMEASAGLLDIVLNGEENGRRERRARSSDDSEYGVDFERRWLE